MQQQIDEEIEAANVPLMKLFVGQLPSGCDEADVHTFFEQFGEILNLTIIKDKLTGKPRGCAFLTYIKNSSAQACMDQLNEKVPFPSATKLLQIKPADPHEKDFKLFVGMLPKSYDEQALYRVFSIYGAVKEVHIIRGPDKQPKGCAFIKYADKQAALKAVQHANNRILDISSVRPIVVKFADASNHRNKINSGEESTDKSNTRGGTYEFSSVPYGYMNVPDHQNTPIMHIPYLSHIMRDQMAPRSDSYPLYYPQNNLMSMSHVSQQDNIYIGHGGIPPYAHMAHSPPHSPPHPGFMTTFMNAPGSPTEQVGPALKINENTESSVERPPEGPRGANLFIYHLPRDIIDADLATLFAPFGNVISAKVFVDPRTSESKGFGFVSYDTPVSADDAINAMSGFQIGTKRLKVQHKKI